MSYRVGPPPPPWKPLLVVDFVASAGGAGIWVCAVWPVFLPRSSFKALETAGLLVPALLATSLAILVHDLGRPSRFWRMLAAFNPRSVMSWGAWILSAFFALSLLPLAVFLLTHWEPVQRLFMRFLMVYLVATLLLAALVLVYKGVLLAVTAVPLWRTGRLLGPLFLADGLALGAAILVATAARPEALLEMRVASVVRVGLMLGTLGLAGGDRPLLSRGRVGMAFGLALALSIVAAAAPVPLAAIGASVLLRAAILRAPYQSARHAHPA